MALPVAWLARRVSAREVLAEARAVGLVPLTVALGCLLGALAVGCVRWRVLLGAYGPGPLPGYGALFRHYLVGQYFSLLPTGLAGDAVRGARVRRAAGSLAASYTVLFIERLTGLFGLCAIAGAAMVGTPGLRADLVLRAFDLAVLGALGLALLAFVAPYLLTRLPTWRKLLARVPVAGALLLRIPAARRPGRALLALPLSVLAQGALVAAMAALLAPLAPEATLAVCARVVPAIVLFTYLPVTPGGVGQREVVAVHLFALARVPPSAATATSLLLFALFLVLGALGALCLLLERVFGWERDGAV